jgi:formylglycine-generating enzyme required for sulfatase activity
MMKKLFSIATLMTLPLLGTASCSNALDPYPAAVFVVDTDMAVPRFVDRLRVDTFSADGTWIDSHDYAILNPRDWPVSFGVFSKDESKATTLYVRLRAYTDLRTRDYRGERYVDATGVVPGPVPPLANQLPRLIVDGKDITPTNEPEPTTTIDRLVQVVLQPAKAGAINLVLRGDCVGTMAQLTSQGSYQPLNPSEAKTCVDTPNIRVGLSPAAIGARSTASSIQGTWNPTTTCKTAPAGTICVPGGAFFIGGSVSVGWDVPTLPQRVVALSPFRMDANEVTVGQWRAAVAKGLVTPDDTPWPYDLAFPTKPDPNFVGCTYSTKPMGREDYPINCVTFAAAHAYCKSVGGDLPTEAQWEYSATAAGRTSESRYPWTTQDYPDCKQSVHGRAMGVRGASACLDSGFGPQPVTTSVGVGQDITPLGIMNLAGSMIEWTSDTLANYDDPCWAAKGPKDPSCQVPNQPRVVRGSYWGTEQAALTDRVSSSNQGYYNSALGFRCVYPEAL